MGKIGEFGVTPPRTRSQISGDALGVEKFMDSLQTVTGLIQSSKTDCFDEVPGLAVGLKV